MSLVGPRPLLVGYLPRYTPRERRRHEMRPGITGWAAVNGRHALRFEARLNDVRYVETWSLGLDFTILVMTIGQVLGRSSVRVTQDFAEIEFPSRFEVGLAGSLPPVARRRLPSGSIKSHRGSGDDRARDPTAAVPASSGDPLAFRR